MPSNFARIFPVSSSGCTLSPSSRAYALNVTVVPSGGLGYLTIWGTGQVPLVSTLNAWDGSITSNFALVPAANDGSIVVYVSDAADVIIDTTGYFAP